jgi:hypothetical protein
MTETSWSEVGVGSAFEFVNEKRWNEGRRTRTTSRQTLLARDDEAAMIETAIVGSLPDPHVETNRMPLHTLPVGAPGVEVTALGAPTGSV